MRALPRLALSAIVLMLLLPPAAAQGPWCGAVDVICQTTTEVVVQPPDAPIPPLGPYFALPVQVRYTYVPTALSTSPTSIHLDVRELPPWAGATLAPSTVYIPVEPVGLQVQTRTASSFLLVSVTADAPAFTQGVVQVVAQAAPNGNLMGSQGRVDVPIQADYFSLLSASMATRSQELAPGQRVQLPMMVTNLGNGLTRVTFGVARAPEGLGITQPEALTLPSRQMGSEENRAPVLWAFEAQPGFQGGDAVLVLQGAYALDPELLGERLEVVLHLPRGPGGDVVTQSLLGSGPGAPPLALGLLAASFAAAALLARWRRGRA